MAAGQQGQAQGTKGQQSLGSVWQAQSSAGSFGSTPLPPPPAYEQLKSETNSYMSQTEITAEIRLLYKVRTKNPGMVESTAARVVLILCTKDRLGPQNKVRAIAFMILEKRALLAATGQVDQERVKPDGGYPQSQGPQPFPQQIDSSPRTAGRVLCIHRCLSNTHGKTVTGNVH
jgi:hypothetical protein